MAAWGLDIWMGRTAQVSLGHGAFLAVGAYTSALLSRQGTPWLASLPAALLVTGALGLVVGHATLRLVGPRLALATLALQVVVEQALTQGGALTGGAMGLPMAPAPVLPTAAVVAAGAAALLWRADRSRLGLAWSGLRHAPTATTAAGVDLPRLRAWTLAASAALTGLAGALMAGQLRLVHPGQFSVDTSLALLVMVTVGGVGRVRGPLLGAALVVTLEAALGPHPLILRALLGGALLITALAAPQGLSGRRPAPSAA
ncbi:MAG: branched-chain amino acid ABC transporter permease [Deltaproteobacteria bacterium]|nr:branched-chain amino acid ABC transporter permease [Deltaproteobacteria bacterium]